jgi:indole-3-glycerol phosphate synthase/phosphoribosylanthranilate isomerase
VPPEIVLISESGIGSRSDAAALAPLVDGFLVGSALMAADDIADVARALVHGRVKLCGLTRDEDIETAAACGATHAGLILVPRTPRALALVDAKRLAAQAARVGLKSVGVFRDEEPAQVLAAAERFELDVVQLHGREPDSQVSDIRSALDGRCEVWAACAVEDAPAEGRTSADRLVFDTSVNGRCGGAGTTFDWESVREHPQFERSLLAGGIGPENAASAAALGAYALDVSSGVESAPGVKDRAKLQALFSQLRLSDRRGDAPCA